MITAKVTGTLVIEYISDGHVTLEKGDALQLNIKLEECPAPTKIKQDEEFDLER